MAYDKNFIDRLTLSKEYQKGRNASGYLNTTIRLKIQYVTI